MVVVAAIQFVIFAVRPLLSYQALALGATPLELGLITSSFSVLSLVAAVPLGRAVDRWGETYFVIAGSGALALVCVALIFAKHVAVLGACSAVMGLGHLVAMVGTQTFIANGSQDRRRDVRFATFTVVSSIGQLTGPAVSGLLLGDVAGTVAGSGEVTHGPRILIMGFAVGALALASGITLRVAPGSLARRPARVRAATKATFARVLALPSMPSAMVASLTVLSSLDLLAAYLPAYGEAHGVSARTVGFLLATQGVASLGARIGMLRLLAVVSRRRLLALSMLAAAGGLTTVPLIASVAGLYAAMVVVGIGLGLGQPITMAWVAAQSPPEMRGTALGVRLSGNRLGQTVVPALVGTIAGSAGLAAAFVAPAVLLAVGGAVVLRSGDRGDEQRWANGDSHVSHQAKSVD